jgi:peptide/nickel transport system substrate-binding protein
LRFSLRGDPKTFEPLQVTEEYSDTVRYLTHAPLIRWNRQTQRPEPALAESWKTTDHGRRIHFRLRKNVKFHDGTPFDASDAAYTLRRIFDTRNKVVAGDPFRAVAAQTRIEVHSPQELSVLFPTALANLEEQFDELPMLSSRSPLGDQAGLGPFVRNEYRPGMYIRLTRNAHYWRRDHSRRALPYLDAIRIDITSSRDAELTRFRRGELHFISAIDAASFDQVAAANPKEARDAGLTMESEMLWFNQVRTSPVAAYKQQWFRSAAFRRAVSESIRREDIARLVYKGRAQAAAGPISPVARQWHNAKLKPHPFDPGHALRRLEQEGFRLENGVLKDSQGHPVEFSLVTNSGNHARARMAALIQQDLAKIGMKVNFVPLDFPSLIERISRSFDYEACLLGLVGVDADPNDQMNVWLSSSAAHQWNPRQKQPETPWEAEIDRLMTEQASMADAGKRKKLVDRFQEIVWEQAPMIYLVHPHALSAVSERLGNVSPVGLRPRLHWNVEWLYLTPSGAVSQVIR